MVCALSLMKIYLTVVGRTTTPFLVEGIKHYCERIRRFSTPFEMRIINDVKTSKKTTEEAQKKAEGEAILTTVSSSDFLILLDERGHQFTSREFSDFINRKSLSGIKNLIFVVGGPYGFSPKVYNRANGMLSLSKMTFPHEMIRLFFVEQIYRALSISANLPYHHD